MGGWTSSTIYNIKLGALHTLYIQKPSSLVTKNSHKTTLACTNQKSLLALTCFYNTSEEKTLNLARELLRICKYEIKMVILL